jgi:hypothetical protein
LGAGPSSPLAVAQAVLLLHDEFTGAGGTLLGDHVPDSHWEWSGYFTGGQAANTWALNGDGTLSQTANPTTTARAYHAWIKAGSSDIKVSTIMTSAASGNFRAGLVARLSDANNMWKAMLNKATNNLELVQTASGADTVRASASMGTLANNTAYPLEFECVGNTLTARSGAVSCSFTSATHQTRLNVGFTELVAVGEAHNKFSALEVYRANNNILPTRFFFSGADGSEATEWDMVSVTGIASNNRAEVNGNWRWRLQITANNLTSAYRLEFQCDASGPVPNPEAVHWIKNLPDEAYYECYYWFPSQVQRLGGFWNILQWKQRDVTATTWPVYALNVGWTTDHMHFELNSNMAADGSYNGEQPDLSEVHYAVPVGQWVKITALYRWHASNGRVAFWLDNNLMWDFDNIPTLFTTGQDWTAPQNPRQFAVNNYADNLGASAVNLYLDNISVAFLAQADNYPTGAPV